MISSLKKCIAEALSHAISRVSGRRLGEVGELFESMKLKITPTPSPELGDYGVALHYILHTDKIPRSEWDRYGERLVRELSASAYWNQCYFSRAEFRNGYLNIWIDYPRLFKDFSARLLRGEIDEELRSHGGGKRIIVEHTSANPIHPLHVGSGRNAVIGNTFANLLRRLGYDVREHFYVDDMGRQVAVLAYGVSLLDKYGIEPRVTRKIDHWYGIVYALTNIIIEEKKLMAKIVEEAARIDDVLDELAEKLVGLYKVTGLAPIYKLYIKASTAKGKKRYIHDKYGLVRELEREASSTMGKIGDQEAASSLKEIMNWLRDNTREFTEAYTEYLEYQEAKTRLGLLEPGVLEALSREIGDPDHAEEAISRLMRKYEAEDPIVSDLFHRVAGDVLEGFKETLSRLRISFDQYDWESSEEIRGLTRIVVEKALRSKYVVTEDKAVILDLDKAAEEDEYVAEVFRGEEPGRFVLRRSDGTTLYGTRDVAYSIYKFEATGAERVYNVIAHEQMREQRQVRAALHLLGYHKYAENLVHLDYEMVHLKGFKMSSRRGRIYTLDELIDDYVAVVVRDYVDNLSRRLGSGKIGEIDAEKLLLTAEDLAVANTRALLLSIDPKKVLVFDPRRLEENLTGSWIMYTYVRLQSILRKHYGYEPLDNMDKIRKDMLSRLENLGSIELERTEKLVLESLIGYPETLLSVEESMETNKILEKTAEICMRLNKFYEELPVLSEKDPVKRDARLILVAVSLLILDDLIRIMNLPRIRRT